MPTKSVQYIDKYMNLLQHFTFTPQKVQINPPIEIKQFFKSLGEYIVICPFAAIAEKTYDMTKVIEISNKLKHKVCILLEKGEEMYYNYLKISPYTFQKPWI